MVPRGRTRGRGHNMKHSRLPLNIRRHPLRGENTQSTSVSFIDRGRFSCGKLESLLQVVVQERVVPDNEQYVRRDLDWKPGASGGYCSMGSRPPTYTLVPCQLWRWMGSSELGRCRLKGVKSWKPVNACFTYGRCTFITCKKASLEDCPQLP